MFAALRSKARTLWARWQHLRYRVWKQNVLHALTTDRIRTQISPLVTYPAMIYLELQADDDFERYGLQGVKARLVDPSLRDPEPEEPEEPLTGDALTPEEMEALIQAHPDAGHPYYNPNVRS